MRLLLVGYGKMGKLIERLAPDYGFEVVGRLDDTNNIGGVAGMYTTPAIHHQTTGVFTNTTPTGPYRGAGRPEATYAIERVIDLAAGRIQPADYPRFVDFARRADDRLTASIRIAR